MKKELDNPRIQAMFRRSRHNNSSTFIISQDYYELRKKSNRANGNICHMFKPNSFGDVQNLYQDKESLDVNNDDFKLLTSTSWSEKYQPLTVDMTKDKYTGRNRLGLNSIFVPDSSPF